ncbi:MULTISPECIES: DUF6274 family protein [unclassified Streptomyces]|uniref:DUF6274 family protein n=1 Tax=unclassified Streptomyces TaxID=2593676 RepID=UPI0029A7E968|nr:DUF6274 family protein [Streptomyces sp. FL07-04A]MDX3579468.1 DUF6274 family protein [Streptomyces sp. FL07-04A]
MAAPVRHETRALLRAHLSAASSYRHLTRHCPICHRLLKLAMDGPSRGSQGPERAAEGESPAPRDTDATGAADSRPA